MEEKKIYKAPDVEDKIDLVEEPAVAYGYGGQERKCRRDVDERYLVSDEAWASRPAVYTEEELDEIVRRSEYEATYSHEEVMAACAKLGYIL